MAAATKNMDLWNGLCKTDPTYTKQFTRSGGFKGTAINGTYIIQRLTEAFGPCGKGWRFVVDDEKYVEGHKLKSGDTAILHVIRGHLEYIMDGQWQATSPQYGQTMVVDQNKYGTFMDEEAPKKSITDCISKCAVLLGIAADVYMGLFDDNKYVNTRRAEEAEEARMEAEEQRRYSQPPTPAPQPHQQPAAAHTAQQQAAPQPQPSPAPAEPQANQMTLEQAKTGFYQVREMIRAAKDEEDLNVAFDGNAQFLADLKAGFPKNHSSLMSEADQKRAALRAAAAGEFQP